MLKIAHIDDDTKDAALFKGWADGAHHKVKHFYNLADFYRSKALYNIIVSDLNLTSTFGLDVVESIKKNRPDTPFIILTGMASGHLTGDICKKYMDAGAANVVPKSMLFFDSFNDLLSEAVSGWVK